MHAKKSIQRVASVLRPHGPCCLNRPAANVEYESMGSRLVKSASHLDCLKNQLYHSRANYIRRCKYEHQKRN